MIHRILYNFSFPFLNMTCNLIIIINNYYLIFITKNMLFLFLPYIMLKVVLYIFFIIN